MRAIKELELVLCEEITNGILLFHRKNNNSVKFIAHKYIKLDSVRDVYYVTCIDNIKIDSFKKCLITFKDILIDAKAIFYVICNINSKESISTNKINFSEIDFIDSMLSCSDFKSRIIDDNEYEILDGVAKEDIYKELNIEDKFVYLMDMDIDDDNQLLHDDIVYINHDGEISDDDNDEISDDEISDDIII